MVQEEAAIAWCARAIYTFSSSAARSLEEDFLICGSGDYAESNPEPWVGEAAHPLFKIWKTNEIGAYGIGAKRLEDLAKGVMRIEVEMPGKSRK